MPPRKKTAAKKKTAKRTTTRATRTKPKRIKRRETPLEKLAFRVSILAEGFDVLEKDLRDLRRSYGDHVVVKIVEGAIPIVKPEAIDVATEPAHVPDEPIACENG